MRPGAPNAHTRLAWITRSVHEAIEKEYRRMRRSAAADADMIAENRLLRLVAELGQAHPGAYAEHMNKRYHLHWRGADVIQAFRRMRISNQEKRAELFAWAQELTRCYERALVSGKAEDITAYDAVKDRRIQQVNGSEQHGCQRRIGVMYLLAHHPEFYPRDDEARLDVLGNVFAKYLLFDLSDILRDACNPARKDVALEARATAVGRGGALAAGERHVAEQPFARGNAHAGSPGGV